MKNIIPNTTHVRSKREIKDQNSETSKSKNESTEIKGCWELNEHKPRLKKCCSLFNPFHFEMPIILSQCQICQYKP